jgi:hypothetical protein
MKQHPTLFSPPMVSAILAGIKTITRRPLLPKDVETVEWLAGGVDQTPATTDAIGQGWHEGEYRVWCDDYPEEGSLPIAAYQPGDLIWVKEAHCLWGDWMPDGFTKTGKVKMRFRCDKNKGVAYAPPSGLQSDRRNGQGWWKRSSLFMPRWASRIELTVTDFRIERLHDITEEDAMAEGIYAVEVFGEKRFAWEDGTSWQTAVDAYHDLWEVINGEGSWDKNPLVRVISFKRTIKRTTA